jgi:hypothetical protein
MDCRLLQTWNWEGGFRYSRNEGKNISIGEVSQPGLRQALLDTDPATAFDPFLNITSHNTRAARAQVYVNLQNTGEYELPIGYLTFNGDLVQSSRGSGLLRDRRRVRRAEVHPRSRLAQQHV